MPMDWIKILKRLSYNLIYRQQEYPLKEEQANKSLTVGLFLFYIENSIYFVSGNKISLLRIFSLFHQFFFRRVDLRGIPIPDMAVEFCRNFIQAKITDASLVGVV